MKNIIIITALYAMLPLVCSILNLINVFCFCCCEVWSRLAWALKTWACCPNRSVFRAKQKAAQHCENCSKNGSYVLKKMLYPQHWAVYFFLSKEPKTGESNEDKGTLMNLIWGLWIWKSEVQKGEIIFFFMVLRHVHNSLAHPVLSENSELFFSATCTSRANWSH